MKNSLKIIAVAFIITTLFCTKGVKAQTVPANAIRFSIGPDVGIPTEKLRIGSNLVLGGNAGLLYGISNNFAITLTSGADHFLSKDIPGTTKKYNSFGIIPIKAGFKEFFIPNIYVAAEAGIGIEETDSGVGNKKFIISPALGYACEHWDVGVRYENLLGQQDNYGFVALHVAYGFKL